MSLLSLRMKETERYETICEIEGDYLRVKEASLILGLSERQVYGIKALVEREEAGGIIHKSRGKCTPPWLTEKIKDTIKSFNRVIQQEKTQLVTLNY
jgi:hypothetical protein